MTDIYDMLAGRAHSQVMHDNASMVIASRPERVDPNSRQLVTMEEVSRWASFASHIIEHLDPLGDRVMVVPFVRRQKGKIILVSDSVAADGEEGNMGLKGVVLACGPGRNLDDGTIQPLAVSAGDLVLYRKYGGEDLVILGVNVQVIAVSEVIAKISCALLEQGEVLDCVPPGQEWVTDAAP